MPWLQPFPSNQEMEFWGVSAPPIFSSSAFQRPSQWPTPNGPRINCLFKLLYSPGEVACPNNWWIYYRLANALPAGEPDIFGAGQLFIDPVEQGHIFGSLGRDVNGVSMMLDIQSFDDLPEVGGQGVRLQYTLTKFGFGAFRNNYYYQLPNFPFRVQTMSNYGTTPAIVSTDITPPWPWQTNATFWQALSDCYITRPALGPVENYTSSANLTYTSSNDEPYEPGTDRQAYLSAAGLRYESSNDESYEPSAAASLSYVNDADQPYQSSEQLIYQGS